MDQQSRFDEISEEYASYYENPSGIMSMEKIRRLQTALTLSSRSTDDRILNIGVGAGEIHREITTSSNTVVGVDFSRGMLETARSRAAGSYVQGAAQLLPFQTESFDIVFCLGVIGYLNEKELDDIVQEFQRILKPGGQLILSFANQNSPFRRLRRIYYYTLLDVLKRITGWGTRIDNPYTTYSPKRVIKLLNANQLRTTNCRYLTYSTGIFNTIINQWLYRWLDNRLSANKMTSSLAMTWILHAEKPTDRSDSGSQRQA